MKLVKIEIGDGYSEVTGGKINFQGDGNYLSVALTEPQIERILVVVRGMYEELFAHAHSKIDDAAAKALAFDASTSTSTAF